MREYAVVLLTAGLVTFLATPVVRMGMFSTSSASQSWRTPSSSV